jgi:hypothetical protein
MPQVHALLALNLVLFSFHLAQPGKAFFARWSPPTPETRCPRLSPTLGMLELLAPCSGVSVLLIPRRGAHSFTLGRVLTIGLPLPMPEIFTACLLVATGPLNSALELPAPF